MLEMNQDEVQQMFDLIPVMLNVNIYIYIYIYIFFFFFFFFKQKG